MDETPLEICRAHGVAMGSIYAGKHRGWTTNEAAADLLRAVEGVRVEAGHNRIGPVGWEVSCFRQPAQP